MSVKEMVMVRSRGNLYLTYNRILAIFLLLLSMGLSIFYLGKVCDGRHA